MGNEINNDKLNFFQNYLKITRNEIDIEKKEMTKILNLKIVIFGVLMAFGIRDTHFSSLGLILLPFAFIAFDYMHAARLTYIISRWEHLESEIIPKIKKELNMDVHFFETSVSKNKEFYYFLERNIRSLFLFIALAAASVTLYTLLSAFVLKDVEIFLLVYMYLLMIFVLLFYLERKHRELFSRLVTYSSKGNHRFRFKSEHRLYTTTGVYLTFVMLMIIHLTILYIHLRLNGIL